MTEQSEYGDTFDIIACMYDRNLINIIGRIFDLLSPVCLANFRLVSKQYRKLVDDDGKTVERLNRSRAWMSRIPVVMPVALNCGHMVTSLAADGEAMVFALLGYDATVNVYDRSSKKISAKIVQSREFPANISGLDYNHEVIVTCAFETMNGDGPYHSVYIWWKHGSLASKVTPHTKMIRSVKITSKYLLTSSNDNTIAVMDITKPHTPSLKYRLTDHLDYVSSIDCDEISMVSVSIDKVLKVWSLETFKCVYSFQTTFPTLRVAMSWPLAATGGHKNVLLWNIEKGFLIRELCFATDNNLSALSMTITPFGKRSKKRLTEVGKINGKPAGTPGTGSTIHIVAGDNRGYICIWDTSVIIAGHKSAYPHRYLQIGTGGSLISCLAINDTSIISGDWCGQVLEWNFL